MGSHGGIFTGTSLGALGGVREDQIEKCVANTLSTGCAFGPQLRQQLIDETGQDPCASAPTAAQARTTCTATVDKSIDCAPKCQAFRPDTPEWANCIQKCHGYSPVDYSGLKAQCQAEGKSYSWLEGGCVDTAKFDGCPPGTMYAKYPDGSEKCIGYSPDLTKATCPAGTTLKAVPGGQACVSPVVPGYVPPAAKPPVVTTPPAVPVEYVPPVKAGLFGLSGTAWLGIIAAAAVLGTAAYNKKAKKPGSKKASRRYSR